MPPGIWLSNNDIDAINQAAAQNVTALLASVLSMAGILIAMMVVVGPVDVVLSARVLLPMALAAAVVLWGPALARRLAEDHEYDGVVMKKGDLVMLEAMGGGFTWGASLVRM